MNKILFVDEQPKIVIQAKKMLEPLLSECEIAFTNSGEKALSLMKNEEFDIIISEINLPGMNGAELLKQIRKWFPHAVRIVCTYKADIEAILRTAGLTHQFVAKPLNTTTLIETVSKAISLSKILKDDNLQKLILGIQSLPSLPSLYFEIVNELQSSDPSSERVAEIISRDMSMAAKVLQLVNSAYFGLPHVVSDPAQAAVLLGMDTIRDLVLSVQIFSEFDVSKLRRLGLSNLWDHSLRVGMVSKEIARSLRLSKEKIDMAFSAGLLHDLGKLVLAENYSMKYYSAIGLSKRKGLTLAEAEKEVFGVTHEQIGAYLVGIWGLPDCTMRSAGYHHDPAKTIADRISIPLIVHIANCFDRELYPRQMVGKFTDIDMELVKSLNLESQIEDWRIKAEILTKKRK